MSSFVSPRQTYQGIKMPAIANKHIVSDKAFASKYIELKLPHSQIAIELTNLASIQAGNSIFDIYFLEGNIVLRKRTNQLKSPISRIYKLPLNNSQPFMVGRSNNNSLMDESPSIANHHFSLLVKTRNHKPPILIITNYSATNGTQIKWE